MTWSSGQLFKGAVLEAVLQEITGEGAIRGQPWVSSGWESVHQQVPVVLGSLMVHSKMHFSFLKYKKKFTVYILHSLNKKKNTYYGLSIFVVHG